MLFIIKEGDGEKQLLALPAQPSATGGKFRVDIKSPAGFQAACCQVWEHVADTVMVNVYSDRHKAVVKQAARVYLSYYRGTFPPVEAK